MSRNYIPDNRLANVYGGDHMYGAITDLDVSSYGRLSQKSITNPCSAHAVRLLNGSHALLTGKRRRTMKRIEKDAAREMHLPGTEKT